MGWVIDELHTHVGFSVRHLMVTTVRGQFKKYSGTLNLDVKDFTRSTLEGTVDVASIDTGVNDRDNHLRTNDFFNAPAFPHIKFKSGRIEAKGDNQFVVHGDITIRDVTKPIALDVEFLGTSKSMRGETKTGFSATTTLNRKDFGVNFNAVLETGGVAVSEKVKIEIEVEATLQP